MRYQQNTLKNTMLHHETRTVMFISPKHASDYFWQPLFNAKK